MFIEILRRIGVRVAPAESTRISARRLRELEDEDLDVIESMSRGARSAVDMSPPRQNEKAITTNMLGPDLKLIRPSKAKPDADASK